MKNTIKKLTISVQGILLLRYFCLQAKHLGQAEGSFAVIRYRHSTSFCPLFSCLAEERQPEKSFQRQKVVFKTKLSTISFILTNLVPSFFIYLH
jgi:hypothetical protein